jgi:Nucleotidyl transferase AbiEii toxin, Type IV TA system
MGSDAVGIGDYDGELTERLLGIAADVLRSFGSAFGGRHLAIVGGSVPSLLVPSPPPNMETHAGTGDLDFHLSLQLMDGETAEYYQAIVDGLRGLGLSPDQSGDRPITWRWTGTYREVSVQVEFLCPARNRSGRPEAPAAETPAEINVGPQGEITALAVGYGHLVLADTTPVERRVVASGGALSFEFPVAGPASWLCLKADAIMRRNKPKDAYDVVWLLDALSPAEVAERVMASPLLAGEFADEVGDQMKRLVGDQFRDTGSIGPRSYARFIRPESEARDRRHAQGTLAEFGNQLVHQGLEL